MSVNEKKISGFGRNLGVGIKPWVKKFGLNWQMHLAKALTEPWNTAYKEFNVPHSKYMREAAREFIMYNTQLHNEGKGMWRRYYKDGQVHITSITLPHSEVVSKMYEDPLRFQAIYGRQKYIDPNAKVLISQFKEQIKFARTRNEKRELKQKLREFEKKVTQDRWRVEYAKINQTYTPDPAMQRKIFKDTSKFLRGVDAENLKMQTMSQELARRRFFDKLYDGRDPGVAIGKGEGMEHLKSDLIRLVNYLKKARWIKRSVWRGIMREENRYVRWFLRKHLGVRKYRELFLSYNAMDKYSTDAKFPAGLEYGEMKASYDNRKDELSPLQRRRVITKGGKEKIRNIKD